MISEEKQLLIIDLCARLPYGVKVDVNFYYDTKELSCDLLQDFITDEKSIRPYLRPMSSMTKEERKELSTRYNFTVRNERIQIRYHSDGYWDDDTECPTEEYLWLFSWLNKHHFDYRGLIEKGLALEAKEGMYEN